MSNTIEPEDAVSLRTAIRDGVREGLEPLHTLAETVERMMLRVSQTASLAEGQLNETPSTLEEWRKQAFDQSDELGRAHARAERLVAALRSLRAIVPVGGSWLGSGAVFAKLRERMLVILADAEVMERDLRVDLDRGAPE